MAQTVTKIGAGNGNGSNYTIAAYNQAAGNCIVVGVETFSGTPTISDTAGNTYATAVTQTISGAKSTIFYAKNCLGNAANVITINTSSGFSSAIAWDISGCDLTSPLSVTAVSTNSSAAATAYSQGFSTLTPNEAVIAFYAVVTSYNTATAATMSGAAVTFDGTSGSGGNQTAGAHTVYTSPQTGGNASFSCTASGTNKPFVIVASFKASGQTNLTTAFVQSASVVDNVGSAVNHYTIAYPNNNVAGDLLFISCGWIANNVSPTISDTQGNTWVALPFLNNGTLNLQAWYCLNAKAGANSVTLTWASSLTTFGAPSISEWAPAAGYAFAIDQHAESATNSNQTITTTVNNDVIFAYEMEGAGYQQYTPDNGWSMRSYPTDGIAANATLFMEDQRQTTAGSITFTKHGTAGCTGIASFSANLVVHSISGTILDGGSNPVSGVTVSYTGTASGSTTTDGSGNYTISSLVDGSYTITPTKTGWTFTPTNSSQTLSGSNITGVNFTGTNTLVATPTFSPVAGSYSGTQSVTVSDTDSGLAGFAMYYTTDGSTPTTGSTLYSGAITVSTTQTVKALAVATGYANSNIGSATYTITAPASGSSDFGFKNDFTF